MAAPEPVRRTQTQVAVETIGAPVPDIPDDARALEGIRATPREIDHPKPSERTTENHPVRKRGVYNPLRHQNGLELRMDHSAMTGPATALLRKLGRRQEQRLTMANEDRRRIISALYHEGPALKPFLRRFSALMAMSVVIAVFGLVSNSTAVVIGAMLVAPLMTPILGLAAAAVMGWPKRVARHAVIVVAASVGAVALAILLGLAMNLDLDPLPSELLARTRPNMLDLGIAVAAGAAGAFAVVRRQAADAMSGAAVAVALVPPLSSIAILLQQGESELAMGAVLLFGTNVVGVIVAAALVFLATGFVPGVQLMFGAQRTVSSFRWIALAVVAMVMMLQFNQPGLLQTVPAFEDVEAVVNDWTAASGEGVELVELTLDVDNGTAMIDLVLAAPGTPPQIDGLAEELSDSLNRKVDLNVQMVMSQTSRATAEEGG